MGWLGWLKNRTQRTQSIKRVQEATMRQLEEVRHANREAGRALGESADRRMSASDRLQRVAIASVERRREDGGSATFDNLLNRSRG